MTAYSLGTLVQARRTLWRVDSQNGDVLHLTAVDEATRQTRLYLPLEAVSPANLPKPDPQITGTPQAHDLMLRAFRLSMIHSTAPLLALMDYTLYRCKGCGKPMLGVDYQAHTQEIHQVRDSGYIPTLYRLFEKMSE